jgi:hypothetical protein
MRNEAHESGDPGVQFDEKTESRISRDTVLLTRYFVRLSKLLRAETNVVNGFENVP